MNSENPETTTSEVPQETVEPQNSLEKYYDSLMYKMKLTKGARYQAARRHQRRATASIWAVIALSMYVFSVSTFLALHDFTNQPALEKLLIIASIIMSAFIIAFSVLEQGKKHDLKAELFLRCAQRIQELHDKLEYELQTKTISNEKIFEVVKDYNETVHDFADNHSETDYRTFRINIGKHKSQWRYVIYHSVKYWLDCWSIMVFAAFGPPIILFSLIYFGAY